MNGDITTQDCAILWQEVRDKQCNHLLFKYDPLRQLVEIVNHKQKIVVDLTEYQPKP